MHWVILNLREAVFWREKNILTGPLSHFGNRHFENVSYTDDDWIRKEWIIRHSKRH
jgi:hypothetical protein